MLRNSQELTVFDPNPKNANPYEEIFKEFKNIKKTNRKMYRWLNSGKILSLVLKMRFFEILQKRSKAFKILKSLETTNVRTSIWDGYNERQCHSEPS
jgi:hypothetical protein